MDWSLKLRSFWDPILHLTNLTGIAGRSTAPAIVAASVAAPVSSISAPFHWNAIRACHVGCFCTLLSFNHIKLYGFSISYTAQVFPWVIFLDGSLMYKYIFFGVISIYKSISISDVEPFDSAKDFGGENFLLRVLAAHGGRRGGGRGARGRVPTGVARDQGGRGRGRGAPPPAGLLGAGS